MLAHHTARGYGHRVSPTEDRDHGGRQSRSADERAEERVERILHHIAQHGAPIRASDGRRPERDFERARVLAENRADEAGRGKMLDEARELVTAAVTEDLLQASEVRPLREDGQRLLNLPPIVTATGAPAGTVSVRVEVHAA